MEAIKLKEKEFIKLENLIMEDYELLKKLLIHESVSGKETELADYVKIILKELNFVVKQDKMGNIYAIRGLAEKYPLINAHLDIVNLNKSYGSYFNNYFSKNTIKDSYLKTESKRYSSLALNNFDYSINSSKSNTNATKKVEVTEEEILKIWKEQSKELKSCFCKEFIKYGFTCKNCINTCKKNKICGYFANNDDLETKKLFAIYKKINETTDEKSNENDFIQETFDLDGKIKNLQPPIKNESMYKAKNKTTSTKDEKYIVNVDLIEDKITGSGKNRVLGGDDKCGLFLALKVAEQLPDLPMKILFTVEEETGCNGVKYFVKHHAKWLEDVKYSLTIDRKDTNHLLWSQRGVRSCTNDFAGELFYQGMMAGIPVSIQDGGSADVVTLRDYVPNAVNMSAGYFKAHTSNEYIVPSAVDKILGWVKNIVKNV